MTNISEIALCSQFSHIKIKDSDERGRFINKVKFIMIEGNVKHTFKTFFKHVVPKNIKVRMKTFTEITYICIIRD